MCKVIAYMHVYMHAKNDKCTTTMYTCINNNVHMYTFCMCSSMGMHELALLTHRLLRPILYICWIQCACTLYIYMYSTVLAVICNVYNIMHSQVRDYYLEADNRPEMDQWVATLARVCGFSPG